MKSLLKNEILRELRNVLAEAVKKEKKFEPQTFKQFTNLVDRLFKTIDVELEKGKTFDEIKRTVVDFIRREKEEVIG